CDENSESLRDRAVPLVEELGSLPIAINQAGSDIYMGKYTFEEYIAKHRQEMTDILQNSADPDAVRENVSVYATFELSLRSIKSYARRSPATAAPSRAALQLLNTFCFFHSQSIPPGDIIVRAAAKIEGIEDWSANGLFSIKKADLRQDRRNRMLGIGWET